MARVDVYDRAELIVGGVSKTVLDLGTTHGTRSPFPTLRARIRHTEGGFTGLEDLRAALGYASQASMQPRFGGRMLADSIRWSPKSVSFTGVHPLAKTQKATGIVDPSLNLPDPELPPDYDTATYSLGWADATDGRIIGDILTLYGCPIGEIVDTGRHFATLAPSAASRFAVRLASDRPGYDLIKEIDALTGCLTYGGPDGRVHRIRATGRPSGSAARTFTEGVDFKGDEASREKSTDDLYNKIVVDGQSGQIDGEGVPIVIHAELSGPSRYIDTPPGTLAYPIQSDLIETQGFADDVAALAYEEKNWRKELVTLPLSYGDSSIRAGMTIAVDAPESLDLTSASRFRVIEVRDGFGAQGYQTTITCEGAGDAIAQGTAPNQPPLPVIAYEIEFEGLANGDIVAVVALDGSASFDPDGAIVSYDWDGTPTAPSPIGDGKKARVAYNPLPTSPPPTVSLTVTDDLGLAATVTVPIAVTGGDAYTREIWIAEGDKLAHSEDTIAYDEYAVAAVVIPEEAGDEAILAATAGGALRRVTLDGTITSPGGPAGVTALAQTRDRNGTPTRAAWAGASAGAIWRSFDDGITWAAVAALPNGGECRAIAESPYQAGDVYAGGGNVLWHSYDNAGSWQAFYTHANAAYVLARFASGITAADQQVQWLGFAGPDASMGPRVVERGGTLAHAFPPGTLAPYDITGLTISLDAERLFVTDAAGRAWTATTGGSEDLTPATGYNLGALGTPGHAIRDGRFPVIWGAGGLATWKSTDEGASTLVVREEPSHMVAYGRLRPYRAIGLTIISQFQAEQTLDLWDGAGNDAPPPNWFTPGYDDSAWLPSYNVIGAIPIHPQVPGTETVWTNPDAAAGSEGLFRRHFAVPSGRIASATLEVRSDNVTVAVYLNGAYLGGDSADNTSLVFDAADVLPHLVPGPLNVLAIRVRDTDGVQAYTSYKLSINGGTP